MELQYCEAFFIWTQTIAQSPNPVILLAAPPHGKNPHPVDSCRIERAYPAFNGRAIK
jgi:hypothetical protein